MNKNVSGLGFIVPVDLAQTSRPALGTSAARRFVPYSEMSNEALKFTIDTLALHQSPFLDDAIKEAAARMEKGEWLELDAPPPSNDNLPEWLKTWPFSLLSRQERQRHRQAKKR